MSSLKEMSWGAEPAPRVGRLAAAALLRAASAVLARLATRLLSGEPAATRSDPRIEFHAEAGAPEGALYVDGRLVGWLPGVSRL